MKTVISFLISIYQALISPLLHQLLGQKNMCRYEVSCSEYARIAITQNGTIKGSAMALKRFLSCQPFVKQYANI